jgi:hypothetical protein
VILGPVVELGEARTEPDEQEHGARDARPARSSSHGGIVSVAVGSAVARQPHQPVAADRLAHWYHPRSTARHLGGEAEDNGMQATRRALLARGLALAVMTVASRHAVAAATAKPAIAVHKSPT